MPTNIAGASLMEVKLVGGLAEASAVSRSSSNLPPAGSLEHTCTDSVLLRQCEAAQGPGSGMFVLS